jgi:hypothetical protein
MSAKRIAKTKKLYTLTLTLSKLPKLFQKGREKNKKVD